MHKFQRQAKPGAKAVRPEKPATQGNAKASKVTAGKAPAVASPKPKP